MGQEIFIGLILLFLGGCSNPRTPPQQEVTKSVTQNGVEKKSNHLEAKFVDIPFPYGLHPQIAKITLRQGKCSLDERECESMQAILGELNQRHMQIQETGVSCQKTDKRGNEADSEAYSDLAAYCKENDIDLFYSFPLGLPSFDNLLNIHWTLQSNHTKYALPEGMQ